MKALSYLSEDAPKVALEIDLLIGLDAVFERMLPNTTLALSTDTRYVCITRNSDDTLQIVYKESAWLHRTPLGVKIEPSVEMYCKCTHNRSLKITEPTDITIYSTTEGRYSEMYYAGLPFVEDADYLRVLLDGLNSLNVIPGIESDE